MNISNVCFMPYKPTAFIQVVLSVKYAHGLKIDNRQCVYSTFAKDIGLWTTVAQTLKRCLLPDHLKTIVPNATIVVFLYILIPSVVHQEKNEVILSYIYAIRCIQKGCFVSLAEMLFRSENYWEKNVPSRQKARALVNNCLFRIRLFSPNRMYGVWLFWPRELYM